MNRGNGWSPTRRDQEVTIENEPANASDMRSFVSDFLARERVPADVIDEVLMAVGEVVANSCRHGRSRSGHGEVLLRCERRDHRIAVTIHDDGPGFDVDSLDVRTPDLLSQGGRGFFLMRQLMDRVKVESDDGGTTVVLERALPK
jgi:anti-sigma regulatory factor (Ser/Thr protein kinase)